MRAMGLAVSMPARGRPAVRVVVLDASGDVFGSLASGGLTVATEFDLKTAHTEWSDIVSQYFQDVSGRVSTLRPDVVVVRRADQFRSGRIRDGPRLRLVVEGGITAAAASHCANTYLWNGDQCAHNYTGSKTDLDALACTLVSATRAEAATAAIGGLLAP